MNCFDNDCECACHHDEDENDGIGDDAIATSSGGLTAILDTIDAYCQPTAQTYMLSYRKDHDKLLSDCFDKIEYVIDGARGDPGKLYPLHERIKRIFDASKVRRR